MGGTGLHAKAAAVKGGSSRGRPSIWMFRDSAPGPARCTHLARSSSWRCVSQLMTLSVVAATRFQSARGKTFWSRIIPNDTSARCVSRNTELTTTAPFTFRTNSPRPKSGAAFTTLAPNFARMARANPQAKSALSNWSATVLFHSSTTRLRER